MGDSISVDRKIAEQKQFQKRFEKLSNDELEAKINKRKQELKIIIDFVKDVVPKRGKEIEWYHGSSHTKVKWELDFGGFLFFYSMGLGMGGGNKITICDWDYPSPRGAHMCLSMYWQVDNDPVDVDFYDNSYPWQEKLKKVMRDKEEIIKSIDGKAEAEKQKQDTAQKETARRTKLLEKAEKLGL